MKKADRQARIREIIAEQEVERQEDLVRVLEAAGIKVTQATVSRDIKELQLIKVPASHGGYRYSLPSQQQVDQDQRLATAIQQGLVELKQSDRIIGLTMQPGHGPLVAMLINANQYPEVFMAVGDDANVLVVCNSALAAHQFATRLARLDQKGGGPDAAGTDD